MRAYERFLDYVKIHTTSDDNSLTNPSSDIQFDLARKLVDEMKSLGINDAIVDDKCYVYGHMDATNGYENAPKIGFIAHMDTSPDFSGKDVNPQIISDYDGGRIQLGDSGRYIDSETNPELKDMAGKTVICTDGTTLLGADDKSGIAEIITAVSEIISENKPHGKICIAFTPDEEIGCGADYFNLDLFDADYAYTVDGGPINEVEYENFNAASAKAIINGVSVHPGYSKGKMVNASLVGMEFNGLLPNNETPSQTEGYEGFFHLTNMSGDVTSAKLEYIIRDHDSDLFEKRKETMISAAEQINAKYGEGTVILEIKDQYRNMLEKIKPHMHLIDNAFKAIEMIGVNPTAVAIRGGTDGARLSFMGLPCPNLGTGGYDFHGPMEHICVEDMDAVVKIIKNIVDLYADFE